MKAQQDGSTCKASYARGLDTRISSVIQNDWACIDNYQGSP